MHGHPKVKLGSTSRTVVLVSTITMIEMLVREVIGIGKFQILLFTDQPKI